LANNQKKASILELRNVSAGYGQAEVIHEISLSLGEGEIVALLGPNGAGKSTTLLTIMGFLPLLRGQMLLHGEDVSALSVEDIAARGVTLVPQGGRTFPTLSVAENLELGGYTLPSRQEVEQTMSTIYELFPVLKKRVRQKANTLSGGERQMLALGRGLMAKPSVLLLDEPSLGLGPIIVHDFMATVQRINREAEVSILLIEQDAKAALPIADCAYVMTVGRIVFESNEPNSLLDRSKLLKLYMADLA
jgi:branched-chain amino acid transport system ATP-binding protein